MNQPVIPERTSRRLWLAVCAVGILGVAVGFGAGGWLVPALHPVVEAPLSDPQPQQVAANREAPIPPAADLGPWTATIQGRCQIRYIPEMQDVEPGSCKLIRGCQIAVCEPEKVPYTFGMGKELMRVEVDQGEYRFSLPPGRYAIGAVMGNQWGSTKRCRFLAGTGSVWEYQTTVEVTAGSVIQLDFDISIPLP